MPFLLFTCVCVRPWVPCERPGFFRTLEFGKFVVKVYSREMLQSTIIFTHEQSKSRIVLSNLICLFFSFCDPNFKSSSSIESMNGLILVKSAHNPPQPSVQFSSVTQSCQTPCDPRHHSTPGLTVHHKFPEFTQTHAHRVGDAIQPSHPLLSPSPPAPNPSQHQGLFQ